MFENAVFIFLNIEFYLGSMVSTFLMVIDNRFFKLLLLLYICNERKDNSPYSHVFESQRIQKKKILILVMPNVVSRIVQLV